MIKKIETSSSVAELLRMKYSPDWEGFEFDEKAKLIKVAEIKEGPVWMVSAQKKNEKIVFLYEVITKFAYLCPVVFLYDPVDTCMYPEGFRDDRGADGKIFEHNGEVAIRWE